MAVDKAEGGAVEHEGDAHGALVPCGDTGTGTGWGMPWDPQAAPAVGGGTQLSPSPGNRAQSPPVLCPGLPALAWTPPHETQTRTPPRAKRVPRPLLVQHVHWDPPSPVPVPHEPHVPPRNAR